MQAESINSLSSLSKTKGTSTRILKICTRKNLQKIIKQFIAFETGRREQQRRGRGEERKKRRRERENEQ